MMFNEPKRIKKHCELWLITQWKNGNGGLEQGLPEFQVCVRNTMGCVHNTGTRVLSQQSFKYLAYMTYWT